jgi:hypothetical protein
LGEHFSRQEIMTAGSLHKTNKAALRYIQAEKKQEHSGLSESAGDAGQGCSNRGAENRIICNIMRICFVTHTKGVVDKTTPFNY